jgi:hypothetical protein
LFERLEQSRLVCPVCIQKGTAVNAESTAVGIAIAAGYSASSRGSW